MFRHLFIYWLDYYPVIIMFVLRIQYIHLRVAYTHAYMYAGMLNKSDYILKGKVERHKTIILRPGLSAGFHQYAAPQAFLIHQ